MTRDSRLLLGFVLIPTLALAVIGLAELRRGTIAVRAQGVIDVAQPLTLALFREWWVGAVIITGLVLAVACVTLVRIQHSSVRFRAQLAGAVGALTPVVTLATSVAWITSTFSAHNPGLWLGCLLPARTLIVSSFLLALVVPAVFLHVLRRGSPRDSQRP